MAATVLTNCKVLINAVDLSDHVRKVTLNYKAADKDTTAMGSTGQTRLPGLTDWDIQVDFNQDWAAAKVDATCFPLVGVGVANFAISIVPVNATVTTNNPAYEGNAMLSDYPPLGVSVGDLAMASVKILGSGTLTRRTS